VAFVHLRGGRDLPQVDGLFANPSGRRQFAERLARGDFGVVARTADMIAGYGFLGFREWEWNPLGIVVPLIDEETFLYDLYTERRVRGSLIGSAVAAELMREAVRRGCHTMYCRVGRHNAASRALFARLDFGRALDVAGVRLVDWMGLYTLRTYNVASFGSRLVDAVDSQGTSLQLWITGGHTRLRVCLPATASRPLA
jgi:GNAT superfamily N-acetyltransferase